LYVSGHSGNFKQYNVYEAVQKIPECVEWRGRIFAIGAQTGIIFNVNLFQCIEAYPFL